jgi:hypothetical protein
MDDKEILEDEIRCLEEKIKELENNENEEEYDNFLDELGDVKIGSLTYSASQVLKEVDEIAYNCGFNDFNDERLTELNEELNEKREEPKELKKADA